MPGSGFRLIHTGQWTPSQASATFVPTSRQMVPEVETLIDAAWDAASQRLGGRLFDGPLARLESLDATPARLRLTLSRTGYKPFLGTNMAHPELADRLGPGVMANPVGVSTVLKTADHFLLLGRRSDKVAYYPGRVHPFAGTLNPDEDGPDVFAAARRELHEELGLAATDLNSDTQRCIGIVEEGLLRQTELLFAVTANLKLCELERRMDLAEHESTVAIAANPQSVERSVVTTDELTPVARAALFVWGKFTFGDAWFRANRPADS